MPKTYSETERNNIRESLRAEGKKCLALYGVKKTTVDDLVRRVNIPKGTFYLFYSSKEALFFDILKSFPDEVEALYLEMLQNLDENLIVTSLTNVFTAILMKFYNDGVYRALDEGELELILRPIGEEEVKAMKVHEKDILVNLFAIFSISDKDDIASFSKGYRALFYLLLHNDKIEDIEKALRVLVRGLVLEMVE